MRKILVVGGVAGGATAAARARRTDEAAEIIMFERGEHISFANCGLPYYIGGEIGDRSALLLQTPESFKARFSVDVRARHEVVAIDRERKQVKVRNLINRDEYSESYTSLVLAPGATPVRPPISGIDRPNIYTLRNVPDADQIKSAVGTTAKRAVVIGAGFIGLEMAENLKNAGLDVVLVEKAAQVLPPLDGDMASFVAMSLDQMGIETILGDGIASFDGAGRAAAVVLESGRRVEGDVFILGIGVRPDLSLAQAAGLEIGETGAIKVDGHMRTSDPSIYAVGDAVEVINLVAGKVSRIPLAGPANKQGRVAGANAAGGDLVFPGALGTAIVRVGDTVAGITGHSERAARKHGFDPKVSYTVSGSHADYYPGSQDMVIKIVFDSSTEKLLGAQIIGSDGVDKRIDVFATALAGGLTVDQLTNLDLAYAPPFGAAKDPTIVAAMVAQNSLNGMLNLITPADLAGRIEGADAFQLVDVRPTYEADLGSLPGAVNIFVDDLRGELSRLNSNLPTVVFDQNGSKGYVAARILMGHGFKQVWSLSGGYIAYSGYEASR
jgi:NADPH-dependent 2,4-dienoyl-CoA reductase/sulfur reductase-like enzyme/rhodanese-related sulfurtransferase